ncbi:MAG: AGE family epimerase/isomerase, partial [Flavisolibacter sp.]
MNILDYAKIYRDNLLEDVIPFWLTHSKDKQFGGYFTCLNTQGSVYDTDKFIWLQCRQVWCFSMLYNSVEKKKEWLDFALHGAEFLKKHGRDKNDNWYFSLDRKGSPLVEPYNIFSDCFACMAFGQLYQATHNKEYADIAVTTFNNILKRQTNPKGMYSKIHNGTRPLKSFALPMILCNLVLEIEHLLDPALVEATIQNGIQSVMNTFYHSETGLILENVNLDGSFSDSFEGRLLNPGHGLESMWFIMDLAKRSKNIVLINKAVNTSINILKHSWDAKFGGIFYFMDIKGSPSQQLEWDQKLWWVHIETIITLLKGYHLTGDNRCWQWFEKVHGYTWDHFPDPQNGEWHGYLNRQGEVLLPLKGGK